MALFVAQTFVERWMPIHIFPHSDNYGSAPGIGKSQRMADKFGLLRLAQQCPVDRSFVIENIGFNARQINSLKSVIRIYFFVLQMILIF